MTRLRLSQSARDDLLEIRLFGVENFGAAADPYFRRFREVFGLLREHPRAGAVQDDLGRDVRCFTHRRHPIFHRSTTEGVKILRIVHHARDIGSVDLDMAP
jgi:toxin ParE1/3/4